MLVDIMLLPSLPHLLFHFCSLRFVYKTSESCIGPQLVSLLLASSMTFNFILLLSKIYPVEQGLLLVECLTVAPGRARGERGGTRDRNRAS